MKLFSYSQYQLVSENVKYHVDNSLSITESIFRIGSDAYLDFVNEVRSLWKKGKIELSEEDQFIIENLQTGKTAIYKDRKTGKNIKVKLDVPEKIRGGEKAFRVYRTKGEKDSEGNLKAVKIEWGDPNATITNCDEGSRKSFLARHKCDTKTLDKDGFTPGYWACNVHRWWKQLGLECDKPW